MSVKTWAGDLKRDEPAMAAGRAARLGRLLRGRQINTMHRLAQGDEGAMEAACYPPPPGLRVTPSLGHLYRLHTRGSGLPSKKGLDGRPRAPAPNVRITRKQPRLGIYGQNQGTWPVVACRVDSLVMHLSYFLTYMCTEFYIS